MWVHVYLPVLILLDRVQIYRRSKLTQREPSVRDYVVLPHLDVQRFDTEDDVQVLLGAVLRHVVRVSVDRILALVDAADLDAELHLHLNTLLLELVVHDHQLGADRVTRYVHVDLLV